MSQSQSVVNMEKVIRIMEQLKKEILRELPSQKSYLKIQDKIRNDLESMELNHHENALVLKGLKLELSKFTKAIDHSKELQTEQFNDLLATLDSGFSDFKQNFNEFRKELQHLHQQDIASLSKNLDEMFQTKLSRVEHSLTPLQKLLSTETFREYFNKSNQQLHDVFSKLHNKTELSTTEILSGQKVLATSDQVSKNTTKLYEALSEKLKELQEKITQSPVPGLIRDTQASLRATIQKSEANVIQKLDNSPVPNLLYKLENSIQKDLKAYFSELLQKYTNSPVPRKLDQLQAQLQTDLQQLTELTNQNTTQLLNRLQSKAFYDPIYKNVGDQISTAHQQTQQRFETAIQKQTEHLSHEKTAQEIRMNTQLIRQEMESLGKEKTITNLHKTLQNYNALPALAKLETQLDKFQKITPTSSDITSLYNSISTLQKQLEKTAKDDAVKDINKLILKYNAIPIIQKAQDTLEKQIHPLATHQDINSLQAKLKQISTDLQKLPSNGSINDLKRLVEITLPERFDESTKEILTANKELLNVNQTNKENLIKQGEFLTQLKNVVHSKASGQSIQDLTKYIEQSLPNLKNEIMADLHQLEKDHTTAQSTLNKNTETITSIAHSTNSFPELEKYIKETGFPELFNRHQDLKQFSSETRDLLSIITGDLEHLRESVALEKSLTEIKQYSSEDGFKRLLSQIKDAIIPVIQNSTTPLAHQQSVQKISRDLDNMLKKVITEIQVTQNSQIKANEMANENRMALKQLPVREEFNEFREAFNLVIQEKLPDIIERNLMSAAKEESLEKVAQEIRNNLKEIFQNQSLLQETSKNTGELLQNTAKSFDNYRETSEDLLVDISSQVSEEAWNRHFEQIKTTTNRLAREDSLTTFKRFYERQSNQISENLEDAKQKTLVNQTKIDGLHDKFENITTLEDLSNFGEFILENVKQPIEAKMMPLLQESAKEGTLKQNHEALTELLSKVANRDQLVDMKAEQESMNKFLYNLLKIIEENQEHEKYLEEQIDSLSEKLTLLFEFIKRVSGV